MKKILYIFAVGLALTGWAMVAEAGAQEAGDGSDSGRAGTREALTNKLDEALLKTVEELKTKPAGEEAGTVRAIVRTRPEHKDALPQQFEKLGARVLKTFAILPAFLIEIPADKIEAVARLSEVVGMSADAGMGP